MVNTTNIAREAGVSSKTVQSYIDLLIDMHIGYLVFPYTKTKSRQLIMSHPKFYFFDTGIVRFLKQHKTFETFKGSEVGHCFEQYVFLELNAYKELNRHHFDICFWRTKSGLEIDFVLQKGNVAIECKIAPSFEKKDIRGLVDFLKEHPESKGIVVSTVDKKRVMQIDEGRFLTVYPIEEFLIDLWSHKILTL